MTAEQEERWSEDTNQLIADEDELVFSVRTSGSLLLEELFTAFPALAAAALSSAVQAHFRQATELKVMQGSRSSSVCHFLLQSRKEPTLSCCRQAGTAKAGRSGRLRCLLSAHYLSSCLRVLLRHTSR